MSISILDYEVRLAGRKKNKRLYSLVICDVCNSPYTLLNKKAIFNNIHLCNFCSCSCASIKKTIEDYKNLGSRLGFTYALNTIPQNVQQKLDNMWQCKMGHLFSRSYNAMGLGSICVECRLSNLHKAIDNLFRERNYTLVGDYPKGTEHKMTIQCKEGHTWRVNFYQLSVQGSGCHFCNKYYKVCPSTMTDEEKALRRDRWNYRSWRSKVHNLCNFTCQACNKRGGFLVAHHLNGYHWDIDNRYNPQNGASLCSPCHKEFHSLFGTRDNTKEQFIEFLKTKVINPT